MGSVKAVSGKVGNVFLLKVSLKIRVAIDVGT